MSNDLPTRIEKESEARTASRLAKYLGLSKATVYAMAKDGRLLHYRFAGSIRFDPNTIAAWLRTQIIVQTR